MNGAGITTFGTKFPQVMVSRLASSSVMLSESSTHKGAGSGTLIWPNVVICAAHTLVGAKLSDIELLLFHECDPKTAPPAGTISSHCTRLAIVPQARILKELESGEKFGLDYSLLAIEWTHFAVVSGSGATASRRVSFPRGVIRPPASYQYGGELIAVGHPDGAPTMATVGKVLVSGEPHPTGKADAYSRSAEYSYADFHIADGMSGCGVFNEQGGFVGVAIGFRTVYPAVDPGSKESYRNPQPKLQYAFLNIGLVAGKVTNGGKAGPASQRIRQWLGGGPPLLPGDPTPDPAVSFDPPM